jgi:2,4-diaminopentanoate dehydrogenase
MRKIRAALYGVGAMNKIAARLMVDKGVEIVGAIARSPEKIGKDVGLVIGLDAELGVPVEADAAEVLRSRHVDIALIATSSYMSDVHAQLRVCAEEGVNAITLAEEALYPWRTSPTLTADLDRLARENGVTLTGGGYQDSYLVNLVVVLLGTAHRIDRVVGRSSFNVDEYGPEVARDQQVGVTLEEFATWSERTERPPTFGGNDLDAIVAASGLTTKRVTTTTRPEVATTEMRCESLELTVAPGRLIGFTDIDTIETFEGPTLSLELSGRLYGEGEADINDWKVTGEPNLHLVNPAVDTQRTTCTQLVNRIPDVINARPGFVTVAELPQLRYRPRSLEQYLHPQ